MNRKKNANPSLFDDFEDGHLKIAVICFNRALVSLLREKIKDAYKQQTFEDIQSGDILWVGHLNGLMHKVTYDRRPELVFMRVDSTKDGARQRAKQYAAQFKTFLEKHAPDDKGLLFDAIFVDEGQDFEPEEFQSLLTLLKPSHKTGEKNLIVFYDDAQNLYARERPVWKQIGIDVQRGDRARIMKECFRNPREIVETAFNILLGSEATSEDKVSLRKYADVENLRKDGLIEEVGSHYKVRFAERTSDYPVTYAFPTRAKEKEWIATEIERLIKREAVRPEDILVLFSYVKDFEDLRDIIRARLGPEHIRNFLRPFGENGDKDNYIFGPKCLTLSTVHGAKGYDAYVVFLAGVDLFHSDAAGRATFYVGATRAKLRLYLTGLDSGLLAEAERVIDRAKGLRS